MSIRSNIMKSIIYPSIDIFRGTKFMDTYRFLKKSQWWSEEKLVEYQNLQLRKLIHHVYENVPYYNRIFKENNISPQQIKTKNDLNIIPPLTKQILRKYSTNDLLAKNISSKRFVLGRTGGSTGEPLQFYRDKIGSKSWDSGAYYRFMEWAGLDVGEKFFQFAGDSLGGFLTNKSKLRIKLEQFLIGSINYSAFKTSGQELDQFIQILNDNKKIHFLRGYPSPIFLLAKHINETSNHPKNITAISCTAEKLYDFQRQEIESAFNASIFDQYGCGELNMIAAQCEKKSLYHIAEERVILEKEEDLTNPNVVRITDLYNYVNPLIRYENGDAVKFSFDDCSCGRKLTTLEMIEGRIHDYIITPSKKLIPGEFFPHLFQSIKGIDQYFILQDKIDSLIIQVKPNENYTKNELEKYIQKIREMTDYQMKIETEIVKEIPLSSSGKRLFIKSNISTDFVYNKN